MNWRDIDVSTFEGLRQLDILTAQRLGWRVEAGALEYDLISPDGDVCLHSFSDASLWAKAFFQGEVDSYTSDLVAAAGLPMHGYALAINIFSDGSGLAYYWNIGRTTEQVSAAAPALAIVRAWHALMDVIEGEGRAE